MTELSPSQLTLIDRIITYADKKGAGDQSLDTEFEGVGVMRVRSPSSTRENYLLSPMMCMVLQGQKITTIGDHSVAYGDGDALIVSIDTPAVSQIVEASTEKPYVVIVIEIDFDIVQSLASEILNGDEATQETPESITAGKCRPALVDAVLRLFELVEEDPLSRKILAPMIMREIHFRLLFEGHAGMLRWLSRPNSRATHINRVLLKLKSDYAENLGVAELADIAGMSVSGFHAHFKAMTGTTPLQYQKDLRLLQARAKLTTTAATVSSIAYDVGYDSVTQFSREYLRKFGKSPSRDRA